MKLRIIAGASLVPVFPAFFAAGVLAVTDPLEAGQWKPLCPEGSMCSAAYAGGDGPFPTASGTLMRHYPVDFSDCYWPWTNFCYSFSTYQPSFFRLYREGRQDLGTGAGDGYGRTSALNAIQLSNGEFLHFNNGNSRHSWTAWDDPVVAAAWHELGPIFQGQAGIRPFGPPVEAGGSIVVGMGGDGFGFNFIYFYQSVDGGSTWTIAAEDEPEEKDFWFGDRHNLAASPGDDALWFIAGTEDSESGRQTTRLWESVDAGRTWTRVDDGSFPAAATRVVHDPVNPSLTYAMAADGLYTSTDRGVSWRSTALGGSVNSLVFVDREPPLARALVAGTGAGVKVSIDEGLSWTDLSAGLLAKPHAVTYADGRLAATSASGYFTCDDVDCAGTSQALPVAEDRGVVEVVEFYNTVLDHYFITGTQVEADMIDQGLAGEGWERTGESFAAWSVGGFSKAVDVCRFYGSLDPGPNSHFYSVSAGECRFLMDLAEQVPDDQPRWNFEGYAFSVIPPSPDVTAPCPEAAVPVYRAYNDGFAKGVDSNHRYTTDLSVVAEMVAKGWLDEGVAFCSVPEEHLQTQ
jgi:hypothetical protein